MQAPTTIDELLDYWPGNIPFKGDLVSKDGSCMCAQAQALHFLGGLTIDELRSLNQRTADKQVAKLFGISLAHSILLRIINDEWEDAPSCVIRNPEQVLGDQAPAVLAFWRHLDRMTPADWEAKWIGAWDIAVATTARKAAREATTAREVAREAAGIEVRGASVAAAWEAAAAAAKASAWNTANDAIRAAAGATNEIQGAAFMRANNQPFSFLPLFGFPDPESILASPV